ncbi:hypothetical protein [Streptomyces sp. NPDC048527]
MIFFLSAIEPGAALATPLHEGRIMLVDQTDRAAVSPDHLRLSG